METKNVLLAIILSTIVLIFWATFFEPPIIEQETAEKQITKKIRIFLLRQLMKAKKKLKLKLQEMM